MIARTMAITMASVALAAPAAAQCGGEGQPYCEMRVCIGPCDPAPKKAKPKPALKNNAMQDNAKARNAELRAENERRRAARARDQAIVDRAAARYNAQEDRCWMDKFGQTPGNWSGSAFPEAVDCSGYITAEPPGVVQRRLSYKRKAEEKAIDADLAARQSERRRIENEAANRERLRALNAEQVAATEAEARGIAAMKAANAAAQKKHRDALARHAREKAAYEARQRDYEAAQSRYEQQMETYRAGGGG